MAMASRLTIRLAATDNIVGTRADCLAGAGLAGDNDFIPWQVGALM